MTVLFEMFTFCGRRGGAEQGGGGGGGCGGGGWGWEEDPSSELSKNISSYLGISNCHV